MNSKHTKDKTIPSKILKYLNRKFFIKNKTFWNIRDS